MNADPRTARDWQLLAERLDPGDELRIGRIRLWRDGGGLWWVQLADPPAGVQFSRSAAAAARKAVWLARRGGMSPASN